MTIRNITSTIITAGIPGLPVVKLANLLCKTYALEKCRPSSFGKSANSITVVCQTKDSKVLAKVEHDLVAAGWVDHTTQEAKSKNVKQLTRDLPVYSAIQLDLKASNGYYYVRVTGAKNPGDPGSQDNRPD